MLAPGLTVVPLLVPFTVIDGEDGDVTPNGALARTL
jgi:hypothetical protein